MVPGEESLRTSMSQDVHGIDRKGKQSLTRSQIWLYVMGYVVLVAGSVGSVWVYRRAAQSDANDAIIPGVYDTKKYQAPSSSMPEGELRKAARPSPPSPEKPAVRCPAMVWMGPSGVPSRSAGLPASAMKRVPVPSTA